MGQNPEMGFEQIAIGDALLAGTKLAGSAMASQAGRQSARATEQAGEYNAAMLERKAASTLDEMRENNVRGRKNARQTMGNVRLESAGANLISDGSVALREQSVADRLEAEILDQERKLLMEADDLNSNAKMTRWESKVRANTQRMGAKGTLLSGFGDSMSILSK